MDGFRQRQWTRRRVLAAMGGVAGSVFVAPRSLFAERPPAPPAVPARRSLATEQDPHHLAWVWQFRHDGSPDAIRETLAGLGLGVVLKTHDGTNWMSHFDPSREAVSGADRVEELANFFEQGGVPFHAWAVVKGRDPTAEAEIAADVLAAGARSLFIDLEPHSGFWTGTTGDAERYGEELRRRQPTARLSTSIDPRPWEIDRIPLTEFAAFSDEISPQVYWRAFSTAANVRRYRAAGDDVDLAGMTPRFVLATALTRLTDFGLPLHPIGDGTTAVRDAWSEFIDESYAAEAQSVSVWRFGVVDAAIWELLKDTPPRRLTWVVQAGDTLGAIAARWDTTVDAIVRTNGITDPNLITVGTTLRAPGGSRDAAGGGGAAATYVVQPGDTLSEIAERFDVSVDALMTANGLADAQLVRIGTTLTIPGGVPATPAASAGATPRTYTVQPGDTLSEIAERFDTTTAALARANGIAKADSVRVGAVLIVP